MANNIPLIYTHSGGFPATPRREGGGGIGLLYIPIQVVCLAHEFPRGLHTKTP